MSNLIPAQRTDLVRQQSSDGQQVPITRATGKSLARLGQRTLVRMATVQAEGLVTGEKLREVNFATREAMTDYTILFKRADALAAGDPLLRDDLRFYLDGYRLGSGEILADLVDSYCRESRS